jgi:hypothetical protein
VLVLIANLQKLRSQIANGTSLTHGDKHR